MVCSVALERERVQQSPVMEERELSVSPGEGVWRVCWVAVRTPACVCSAREVGSLSVGSGALPELLCDLGFITEPLCLSFIIRKTQIISNTYLTGRLQPGSV